MIDELRYQSIILAQPLENWNDVGILLKNAEQIREYLSGHRKPAESGPQTPDVERDVKLSSAQIAIQFINKLQVQHPVQGPVDFELYPYQIRMVEYLDQSQFLIISHARQMGITTTMLAYALYQAATRPNETILLLGDRYIHCVELMNRLRFFADHYPDLDLGVTEYNKGNISFINGSKIITRTMTSDATKGLSITQTYIDNAAYIRNDRFEDSWANLLHSTGKTGKIVLASTPNTTEGMFHRIWTSGGLKWRKLMLPWYEHPHRYPEWAAPFCDSLGDKLFAQEYCCEFSAIDR